jgi:DNA-binding transcriptional LysR family regulator
MRPILQELSTKAAQSSCASLGVAEAEADGNALNLDLNLLRVLVSLGETRNVTMTAERLGVTQPTVSYGLSKLRARFHDRLFVRGPLGMHPTPLGEQLVKEFGQAMTQVNRAMESAQRFEPSTTKRRFKVAMSDIGGLYFMPPLLAHLGQCAPLAELEIRQVALDETIEDLASGAIDAAVGNLPIPAGHTRSELLFREHYVCLAGRKRHPGKVPMDLEHFLGSRHVLVSSPFSGHQLVEDALRAQGVSRRIAVTIPHFTVLPGLIARSDLLVTLPSRVARMFEAFGGLRSVELPVTLPEFEVRVHWHVRHETSVPVAWFRQQLIDSLRPL